MPKGRGKETVKAVMHKFGAGKLHSGSKTGPIVHDRKKAIAIALAESREKPAGGKKKPSGPLGRLFGR